METLEVAFFTENETTDGADDVALHTESFVICQHQNQLEMDWCGLKKDCEVTQMPCGVCYSALM